MDTFGQDLFREMGIGTRLKRLTEYLSADCTRLYTEAGESFKVGQFYAVYALHKLGPMTIGRLVTLSGFSQSAVSQTLKRLESDDLVRFCTTSDARERCAELTDAGSALVSRLMPRWQCVEAAVQEAVAESGADFFAALDALETAFREKSLYARVADMPSVPKLGAFTIEPYNVNYATAFKDLNVRWLEAYFEVEPVDVTALTDPNGYILNAGGEIWFAVKGGVAVGCYGLKHTQPGEFEFTKFAVDPSMQGTGVGRALMEHAIERFKARGGHRLFLDTNTRLKAAAALYEKTGWVKIERDGDSPYARCDATWEWRSTETAKDVA